MAIEDKLGTMKTVSKRFGVNLKRIRTEKKMSQGDIIKVTGMDRGYISSVENGRQNPTLVTIEKFAKALEVSMEELMK